RSRTRRRLARRGSPASRARAGLALYVRRLAALWPPHDVAALHRQYVASVAASLAKLDAGLARLRGGAITRAAFLRALRRGLAADAKVESRLANAMKLRGYD